MTRFLEDWDDVPHECVRFDPDGPVVTREQLEALAARWDTLPHGWVPRVEFSAFFATFRTNDGDPIGAIRRDPAGLYHLAPLGLETYAISDAWNGSEPTEES